MAGSILVCVNCGGEMVRSPRQYQQARSGEVAVQWTRCPYCQHASISTWSWTHPVAEEPCVAKEMS